MTEVARQPRRLSPLTPLARAPILVLAVLGGSWQQALDRGSLGVTGLILLGVLAAGAVYGVASWLRTTYWIDDEELRIDTGVVVRQSRRIRIDRLQGVDILQPLVARLLGLAELRLDTAGGDREGRLAFLPHAEALQLRRTLLERRDDLVGAPAGGAVGRAADGAPPGAAPQPAERVLARLDLGMLVLSLALSTEAAVAVVGTVVGVGLSVALGQAAVAGALLPALLGLGLSVARRLTGYYAFTLSESPAGLHVRRGLTALSSQTVAPARIQGFVVHEPLLWRRLGWSRLEVSVAGQASADSDAVQASSTILPVAPRAEAFALVTHLLGRDPGAVVLEPAPRRAAWLAPLTWWNLAAGQDAALTVSRRGWWFRRTDVVPQARVQSVRLTQGPLQRRLGLADVHVDSPPGPVQVRGAQRAAPAAHRFLLDGVRAAREARRPGHPGQREAGSPGSVPPAPETTQ